MQPEEKPTAEPKSKAFITTTVAIVGCILAIGGFLFRRMDVMEKRREMERENRPVLIIKRGVIVAREGVPKRFEELTEPIREKMRQGLIDPATFFRERREYDHVLISVDNLGKQIAGDVRLGLAQYGRDSEVPLWTFKDFDVAPGKSIDSQFTMQFDIEEESAVNKERRIHGMIAYVDKIEPSHKFEEHFCFLIPFKFDNPEKSKRTMAWVEDYEPPRDMQPCPD
jgi:hypothetical protein